MQKAERFYGEEYSAHILICGNCGTNNIKMKTNAPKVFYCYKLQTNYTNQKLPGKNVLPSASLSLYLLYCY